MKNVIDYLQDILREAQHIRTSNELDDHTVPILHAETIVLKATAALAELDVKGHPIQVVPSANFMQGLFDTIESLDLPDPEAEFEADETHKWEVLCDTLENWVDVLSSPQLALDALCESRYFVEKYDEMSGRRTKDLQDIQEQIDALLAEYTRLRPSTEGVCSG